MHLLKTLGAAALFSLTGAFAAQAADPWEIDCGVLKKDKKGEDALLILDDFNVAERSAADVFALTDDEADALDGSDSKAAAVFCSRSSPTPRENDYKIPAAGYAFYIYAYRDWAPPENLKKRKRDKEPSPDIIAGLSLSDGTYVYSVLQGELSDAEKADVDARVASFNAMSAPQTDDAGMGDAETEDSGDESQ